MNNHKYTYSNGESIQFPKPESEIRFGWGMSYNYIGQMHHNLNKYDVVVGLDIFDFRVIHTTNHSVEIQTTVTNGTLVLELSCYLKPVKRFGQLTLQLYPNWVIVKKEIKHIMEKEIPAVVPDFKLRPAPTETSTSQP